MEEYKVANKEDRKETSFNAKDPNKTKEDLRKKTGISRHNRSIQGF